MASSTPEKKHLKDTAEEAEGSEEEENEDVDDAMAPVLSPSTEIPFSNHTSQSDGTLSVNVFTSAEELERAQRLEERERIIREIWRNGQPDILGTGTGTIGRVHYYWLVRLEGNAVNSERDGKPPQHMENVPVSHWLATGPGQSSTVWYCTSCIAASQLLIGN